MVFFTARNISFDRPARNRHADSVSHPDFFGDHIMSSGHSDRDATSWPADGLPGPEPARYPTNHVVAVLDTEDQVLDAAAALTSGGFLPSEVDVATGARAADRLKTSVGRSGVTGLAIRIAQRLGAQDEEMELKTYYEQAMRDDKFVLRVDAPTDERKGVAASILREHGAHSVNYFGRFTIETLAPSDGS
jgi:hypothetical protein